MSRGRFQDGGARLERHTTGRAHMPTAVRKAEAGAPETETPSQVAANRCAVSSRRVGPEA